MVHTGDNQHIRGSKRIARVGCLLAAVVLVLTAVMPAGAQTASNTYVVVGTVGIVKDNIPAARQEAIASALVTALGLAAARLMPVEEMVKRTDALNNTLYNNTGKFIQDYKVLSEGPVDKYYRVLVQATVSGNRVKNALTKTGILRAQKTMPRVLFLVAEQDFENPSPRYWWGPGMAYVKPITETAMADTLREEGYKVIDHGPQVQEMALRSMENSPEVNTDEAVRLGLALNADVVVVGRSIAANAPNTMGSGLRSFKGIINARAFRTKSGMEIASVTRTAVTANMDEIAGSRDALKGAGSLAGEELAREVALAWQKEGLEADRIEIQVSGTRNLANFVMFRRRLNSVEGVQSVMVRELKADDAQLSVEYKGKPRKLADALMLNAFDTFGINIYEVSETGLKIQLIANAAQ
jgi:hypothetical protein